MRSILLFATLLSSSVLEIGCTIGDPPTGAIVPTVDESQRKYPNVTTLWETTIYRTCGPNNGVCHQNKQFPHMEVGTSLLDGVNAQCNQLRNVKSTVDNMCEPPGDWLSINGVRSRIGTTNRVMDGTTEILDVIVKDPFPAGTPNTNVMVVRERPGASKIELPIPDWLLVSVSGNKASFNWKDISYRWHAPGPAQATSGTFLGSMGAFLSPLQYINAGDDQQVELGDPNGDGVFGAELGGFEIKPGDPMMSYLYLRIAGPLTHGGGEILTSMLQDQSVQPQMPIANFQYWDLDNALVSMWCWISGLEADGSNGLDDIDYAGCDLSAMPPVRRQGGEASTFSSIYSGIIVPACGSCHSAGGQASTFVYTDEGKTYSALLGIDGSKPTQGGGMPYIKENVPEESYLFLKIKGMASGGDRMPLAESLPASSITAIETWIRQGANPN